MEVAPVVVGARDRFGVDVTVVRLLETEECWPPHGGQVTYLAETVDPPNGLDPVVVDMDDQPRRARWAKPGGVAALVAWADQYVERTGPVEQLRTWNLSLVARLPIDDGALLLRDIPGDDRYDAPAEECAEMVRRWVEVQASWSGTVAGLPDWTAASLVPQLQRLVDRPEVQALVDELPARFDALAECGLDDTLVHGDFHTGNWRGTTLIDWGDSGFGHPLFDQPAFLNGTTMTDEKRAAAVGAWRDAWQRARPGSDPDRAASLIAPIAALRQAHIYRMFLDNIEPSEWCYHRLDTPEWLARAVALANSTQ
jgi:hypothetical protein